MKYYILSFAIHGSLLLLALLAPQGEGKRGSGGGSQQQLFKIIPRHDIAKKAPDVYKNKGPGLKQKKKKKPCNGKPYYEGVGIVGDVGQSIWHAVPGYPAYLAGIRDGDFILSADPAEIKGEAGTVVKLVIKRGENMLHFEVIRSIICYEQ